MTTSILRRIPLLSFILTFALLLPMFAFAQVDSTQLTAPMDAGASTSALDAASSKAVAFDFAAWSADPANLEAASKLLLTAIQHGNWALLVSALVTLIIALLRKFIAPTTVVGKWFRSKLGAIITNLVLSVGGGLTTAFASGEPISLALVLKALTVAFSAAGLWGVWKAIGESITEKKAQDAGTAATEAPKKTLDK